MLVVHVHACIRCAQASCRLCPANTRLHPSRSGSTVASSSDCLCQPGTHACCSGPARAGTAPSVTDRGEHRPGADVADASPILVQMWEGASLVRRRCGEGMARSQQKPPHLTFSTFFFLPVLLPFVLSVLSFFRCDIEMQPWAATVPVDARSCTRRLLRTKWRGRQGTRRRLAPPKSAQPPFSPCRLDALPLQHRRTLVTQLGRSVCIAYEPNGCQF